jgi:small-conductance mechanosensitive channel/CRP-like cAMP-binding protein
MLDVVKMRAMAHQPHKVIFVRQVSLLMGLLLATFLLSEWISFSEGYWRYFEQFVKAVLVLGIAKLSYTMIVQQLTFYYHRAHKRAPSYFMIQIVQFFVVFLTILALVVFVFHQPVFSIMALGGVVGAGVALGVGPLILDAFSGLVHEAERLFDVGDWLEVDEKHVGKIRSISWRVITLETNDKTLVVIPHRKLSDSYTNLSKPQRSLMQTVEVTLDHTIPVDRAERLLTGAVALVDGVHNHTCSAWALKATEGGIVYAVRYLIKEYDHWREIKHRVLEAITRDLHLYGLKLSETIGEYALSRGGKPFKEYHPLVPEHLFARVDLFHKLPSTALEALAQSAQKQLYPAGSDIVQQDEAGGSLFIIAEGVVEILLKDAHKLTSVAHLASGAYFGEMSLLTGDPRSATVRAVTNCMVYEIGKSEITPILKKNPTIIEALAEQLETRKTMNMRKQKSVRQKVKKETPSKTKLVSTIKAYFNF